ncbi:hypothetical protein M407DRAFT_26813 [Tulasnella calospora MUT 4182]|uniref:Uncharacterized protein n=1 Tax=Tulasnella calospora MUT 4182 TaxID=1051891 RepID=A0A0C3QF19_9AGAM|nr:hypothetical protein M407DRAFT_26813 [Tulasnella calospora MUT 4182]
MSDTYAAELDDDLDALLLDFEFPAPPPTEPVAPSPPPTEPVAPLPPPVTRPDNSSTPHATSFPAADQLAQVSPGHPKQTVIPPPIFLPPNNASKGKPPSNHGSSSKIPRSTALASSRKSSTPSERPANAGASLSVSVAMRSSTSSKRSLMDIDAHQSEVPVASRCPVETAAVAVPPAVATPPAGTSSRPSNKSQVHVQKVTTAHASSAPSPNSGSSSVQRVLRNRPQTRGQVQQATSAATVTAIVVVSSDESDAYQPGGDDQSLGEEEVEEQDEDDDDEGRAAQKKRKSAAGVKKPSAKKQRLSESNSTVADAPPTTAKQAKVLKTYLAPTQASSARSATAKPKPPKRASTTQVDQPAIADTAAGPSRLDKGKGKLLEVVEDSNDQPSTSGAAALNVSTVKPKSKYQSTKISNTEGTNIANQISGAIRYKADQELKKKAIDAFIAAENAEQAIANQKAADSLREAAKLALELSKLSISAGAKGITLPSEVIRSAIKQGLLSMQPFSDGTLDKVV